jgi:hypothetical protein
MPTTLDSLGWRRSAKGNLWRMVGDLCVTVFERSGYYQWCVADRGGPSYSKMTFGTEDEAVESVEEWIRATEG